MTLIFFYLRIQRAILNASLLNKQDILLIRTAIQFELYLRFNSN